MAAIDFDFLRTSFLNDEHLMRTVLFRLATFYLLWKAIATLYSVFFGPLSKFPGPRMAATTQWYRTYIELVQNISMSTKLKELHEKYGPVVRIGPNELHFSSPNSYNAIYQQKFDKEPVLYKSFGEDESSFGYLSVKEAKPRKDLLNPLFSRRETIRMQSLVQEKMDKLCKNLAKRYENGESSDMLMALRCAAMDVITTFCFAKSIETLDEPGFQAPLIIAMESTLPSFLLFRHFPLIRWMVFSMPPWLTMITAPKMKGLLDLQKILSAQIAEVKANPSVLEKTPHRTMYHPLLQEANVSAKSLYEEGQAMLFAGTDTVSNTVMLAIFHILEQPAVYKRLQDELIEFWPDLNTTPRYEELEKLPFLAAVVKESLRLTPAVAAGLLRIVGPNSANIDGFEVPAGTVVSMAILFMHMNKNVFRHGEKFVPEAWLEPGAKELESKLIPFSKGPRSCLGQNLAYCELYLMFANIFRRFDLTLDGTVASDLEWRECFLPWYYKRHIHCYTKPRTA